MHPLTHLWFWENVPERRNPPKCSLRATKGTVSSHTNRAMSPCYSKLYHKDASTKDNKQSRREKHSPKQKTATDPRKENSKRTIHTEKNKRDLIRK